MPVEVLFKFKWDGTGQKSYSMTEPHVYNADPDDLETLADTVRDVYNLRAKMMAENVICQGFRISRIGVFRDYYNETPFDVEGGGKGISKNGGQSGFKADVPNVALQCAVSSGTSRHSNLYLSGLPDALLGTDNDPAVGAGPYYDRCPNWLKAFNSYRVKLYGGSWGFWALLDTVRHPILTWGQTADAPFQLIATLAQTEDFAEVGDTIKIRGVQMKYKGAPKLNGEHKVVAKAVGSGTVDYTLKGTEGMDLNLIVTDGTAETITHGFFPYTKIVPANQTSRKRGGSSSRARGRSSSRR